jgi:hypothetical protein
MKLFLVERINNIVIDLVKHKSRLIENERRNEMNVSNQDKQDDFIRRGTEKYNGKFTYDKVVYVNSRTKVIVTYPDHGDLLVYPYNHLNKKYGCFECSNNVHKLEYISDKKLEEFNKIHSGKYLYEDLKITDGVINITCPDHGIFKQSIYIHSYGHGYNECNLHSRRIIRSKICICCNVDKLIDMYGKHFQVCKECVEDKSHYKQIRERTNLRKKDRLKSDPFYRAQSDARDLIRKSLSESGYTKKTRTYEILGCSYIEFKEYLESLFLPNMSWENRSEWHIDHIIPISFAQNEEELLLINHYSNLRPIWAFDNISKGSRIIVETDLYNKILENRNG